MAASTAPDGHIRGSTASIDKLEAFGIDAIVDLIYDGMMLRQIADTIGVAQSRMSDWLAKSPERSARVIEARARSADQWDAKAEAVLQAARDKDEIAVARELAHHYRWRASKLAPRTYGDRVTQEHVGAGGGAIQVVTGVPVQPSVIADAVAPLLLDAPPLAQTCQSPDEPS